MSENSMPISTSWLLDSVGETGRSVVKAVYMLVCYKTQQKGTAFLLKSGFLLSNYHVIEGSKVDDLIAVSSEGKDIKIKHIYSDQNRDLVALVPRQDLSGGLTIKEESGIEIGTKMSTWGYPLGYNGPAPLLTVGYLSGFNDSPPYEETSSVVKHLVVNSAFNPGNSGGPLMVFGDKEAIGVVVSKHAPLTHFIASAIKALSETKSGVVFN